MEQLLRWGIANSDPNAPPPQPRTDLDPGVIDDILGKSDAELMKEALTVAVDEKRDEDERLQALDDFEMLIEQIDNANSEYAHVSWTDKRGLTLRGVDLEKLKMWEPLHALLTSPTSSEAIQMATLWILGTAVQNNPSAQNSVSTSVPSVLRMPSLTGHFHSTSRSRPSAPSSPSSRQQCALARHARKPCTRFLVSSSTTLRL